MPTLNGSTQPTSPFRQAVEADARGQATPRQLLMLEADPDRRLLILNELKRDVEAQYTSHKADLAEAKARCRALGPDGRQEWAEAEAEYYGWKRGADRFKSGVEKSIARVKLAQKRAIGEMPNGLVNRLRSLEDRVATLEGER